ncbi:hypothetical protein SLE2022_039610 [Rubroshorea leprosula]
MVAHLLKQSRSFVDAKVKLVCDPYLDYFLKREKDPFPQKPNPTSHATTTAAAAAAAARLFRKYPSFFSQFQPSPFLSLQVMLTSSNDPLQKRISQSQLDVSPE